MIADPPEDISTILAPPTALVHVAHAAHLVFAIKDWRASWTLAVGRAYELTVHAYSGGGDARHLLFPADNVRVHTLLAASHLRVDFRSANGSYLVVTGLRSGHTRAEASLLGTVDAHGKLNR